MKLTDEQYIQIGRAAVKTWLIPRGIAEASLAAGKAAWAVAEPIARDHYLREMSEESPDATVEAVAVLLKGGTSADEIVAKVRELDANKEQP